MKSPPHSRRASAPLAVGLAIVTIAAGCGGGAALDDVAKTAWARLNRAIERPAARVAAKAPSVSQTEVTDAMLSAFCEGYRVYVEYGGFPTNQEWYDIAASRLVALGVPHQAAVSQVISIYQNLAYGFETGQFHRAAMDLYCL